MLNPHIRDTLSFLAKCLPVLQGIIRNPNYPFLSMYCPLCANDRFIPSWIGSTYFLSSEYTYVQCADCRSMYCTPMPDDATLAVMYGPEYTSGFADHSAVSDPKEPERVIEWLRRAGKGVFIDFGCGQGEVLRLAAKLGWQAVGVEYDELVVRKVSESTGLQVLSAAEISGSGIQADVLHLGDVIEHLTRVDQELFDILSLLRPGGLLLAQGPLEANPTLFTWFLRLGRMVKQTRREMAPYHVMLATSVGQRSLFRRFGLDSVEYTVHETDWPAPSRLGLKDWLNYRSVILFSARKASQGISAIRPGKWGNRYFYCGRWPGRKEPAAIKTDSGSNGRDNSLSAEV